MNETFEMMLWGLRKVAAALAVFVLFGVLIIALMSALAGASLGQHCRIHVEGDGSTGSGTLVSEFGNCGIVVTCDHIFTDSQQGISCRFPDGQGFMATILQRDKAHDLCVLQIAKPSIRGVEFGDPGAPPQQVTVCGFGPDGQFRSANGTVVRLEYAIGAKFPHCVANVAVRPGDSGGAVLDEQGRLVGIVWGCTEGQTRFFAGEPFWSIVTQTQCYSGNCRNGVCYPPQGYWVQPSRPSRPVMPAPPPIQNPPMTNPPVATKPPVPPPGCDCKEKWEAQVKINNELTATLNTIKQQHQEFKTSIEQQNTRITNLETANQQISTVIDQRIQNYFAQNPQAKPPTVDDVLTKLNDHETPIRVYSPDGRLAGETKSNLFKKDGSIDFTFNPRALLDASK